MFELTPKGVIHTISVYIKKIGENMKKTNKNMKKNEQKSQMEYAIETISTYEKRNQEVKKEFLSDIEIEYKGEISIIEGMTEEEFAEEVKIAEKEWNEIKNEVVTVSKMIKGKIVKEDKALSEQNGKEMYGSMKLVSIESNYKIFWYVWREFKIQQMKRDFTKAQWKAIEMKVSELKGE